MRAAGFTARWIKQAQLLAEITPPEFEILLQRADTAQAADRAIDRELRRMIRERRS